MLKQFSITGWSKVWFAISTMLVIVSIIAIGYNGLNLGIDFTGGTLMEVEFENEVTLEQVRAEFDAQGYDVTVQSGETSYIARLAPITDEEHQSILSGLEGIGSFEELRYESVGPVIGSELKKKSLSAIAMLLVLIVAYVAWAFRKVSKPIASWKYGLLTIIAAAHDVIIPLGIFSILGALYGYQVDTAFVAAMLTIMGYSINDTIVVFDRVRENLVSNRHSDRPFGETVEMSVRQTLARSLNTSVTTLLVLLAIFFFGGETTKEFVMALIIGIVSGAYSSIFLASPLLVEWEKLRK